MLDSETNNTAETCNADAAVSPRCQPEPIAIIGMGCRFPGGASEPDAFWDLLVQGRDAITEVPAERWNLRSFYDPRPGIPGKTVACWGGFLEGIDRFDPHFFGISTREACRMDPQQRLLLETAWEALEDGGQVVEQLAGSKTAVFVGISTWDFSVLQMSFRDRAVLDVHSNTGGTLCIAANRISYCLDLEGPSAAVDTACSSSLVAIHLACQSIWNEQCPLALAGGVNALLLPDWFIGFSRMGVLSPDGRCKAFDSRANGYVRSEGAGMVVLKPLSRALADGDRIYAVIRGTAVNQDGHTSGMTVPSQESQEALLRQACRNAGVSPDQIQYVEAHGTGTPVGDPIEARALGTVLGAGRPKDRPCLIGSVKTNIGHLEAGAGIAGLIKMALALHHRRIPGNLHFVQPNPQIDFESLNLRVAQGVQPWPAAEGPALAAVNSFGYGGTNAHVIMQGWEAEERDKETRRPGDKEIGRNNGHSSLSPCLPVSLSPCLLVPLSARSPEALRAAAGNLQRFVADCPAEVSLEDIAASAALRRSHHDHRLAIVTHSREELAQHLAEFAAGKHPAGYAGDRVIAGQRSRAHPTGCKLAFVCSGQGPQWWAMGRQLLAQEPVFRDMIHRCDAIVRRLGSWSLLEELNADEAHSRMAVTAISQPAIFAVQVALAALYRSWGVQPEAVIGHSVGEVAAAYLAGVFTLEDAVRVIYQRGRCMELAPLRGRMLAAGLTYEEARQVVADHGDRVSIAAVNGPTSVTLSGEPAPLEDIAADLEQRQVFCRFLQVQYAFHSSQMDPIRDELLASLQGIQPRPATLPFFSTVTGQRVEGPELGPDYWWHNVRQMVRFAEGVDHLLQIDCDAFLELSPHPVLTMAVAECAQRSGKRVHTCHSLRRNEEERATLLRSVGLLYSLGYPVDWSGIVPESHRFVRLPLYPWQRERCWVESEESRLSRLTGPAHPLLGQPFSSPRPTWETRLDLQRLPTLADHRIQRAALMPAAAFLEMALATAREVLGPAGTPGTALVQVEDVKLANPCFLSQDRPLWLRTIYHPDERLVQIHTRAINNEQEWTGHFQAVVRSQPTSEPDQRAPERFSPQEIQQRCPQSFTRQECYRYFQQMGLDYGPLFQGIEQGWHGNQEALALISLPEGLASEVGDYLFHPALLDACFQTLIPSDKDYDEVVSPLYLPAEFEQIRIYRRPGTRLWNHARTLVKTDRWSVAELDIYEETGELVAQVRGMRCQRVSGRDMDEALDELLYAYEWQLQDLPNPATQPAESVREGGHWLLFADRGGVGEQLAQWLRLGGASCTLVFPGTAFEDLGDDRFQINPGSAEDMAQLLANRDFQVPAALRGIVHLWNLDAPSSHALNTADLEAAQEAGLLSVLHLVQAWDKLGNDRVPRLFLVTRGAQSVGAKPEAVAVAQSPVIGFGRVIVSEYPRMHCKMVDLDPNAEDASVQWLLDELNVADEEDEIALRGSSRYVHRFLPSPRPAASPRREREDLPYRLQTSRPGSLEALTLRSLRRRPPSPGEVEIEVLAAGLNFSDVLKALGIYPGLADGPIPLGAECSGRITAVGEGVQGLAVGDEVLAVAPFAFSSHVTTRAEFVVPKPSSISFAEAATLPIAFLTASYAMNSLAHLGAGERILIHSATGGVGLAAVQLARQAGAEIFATAGSSEKRDYLRQLGIEQVMDSRSTAFADEVLQRTNGQGVDVVLNSLAGEGLVRSLATLADYGRFLEIGKRDIYGNSRIGLRPFRKNLSFFAIDLDRMMRERPALLGSLLRKLVQQVSAGALKPLPHKVFPISDVQGAFRHMQAGKHIGKIILSLQDQPVAVEPGEEPVTFRADASYLITGGLGGFGLAVAQWMVERGARNLVLMSRRGVHSEETRQVVADLKQRGARVLAPKADVSRPEDVAAVLAEMDRSMPPLRGVIHSAMVLEDSLLQNLDPALMRRVLAPKVSGAWNLHTLTRDRELDFLVLFSSLSSVFGHAGQGNYSAANLFLDSLSWYRRSLGLPGLTINWGYLGDVGYLAQRQQLGERLERQGVLSFSIRHALALLERAMQRQAVQISVMRVDWSRWRGLGVTGHVSPRFAHLLKETQGSAGKESPNGLPGLDTVLAAAPAERPDLMDSLLRDKVARILGENPQQLDGQKSLLNLGLDSLMAVELRNWIESELRVNLPIVELMRSPSLVRLNELLLEQLAQGEPGASATGGSSTEYDGLSTPVADAPGSPAPGPEELIGSVNQMSSEQIDALLAALLADKNRGV